MPAPAPIPMTGISRRWGEQLRDGGRNRFEHDREAAGILERERVARDRQGALGGATLGAVAAERRRGLRGQPDVAHHGNPGVDDRAGPLDAGPASLELDGVAAGLLDESLGGGDRLLVRGLVGPERQVADQERGLTSAPHGAGKHQHLFVDTGTVEGYPSTVIAPESPTSTTSTPASSATCADG